MPTIDRSLAGTTAFGEVVFAQVDYLPQSGATYIVKTPSPGWLSRVAERCAYLFSMPAGWDGYAAPKVDPDLIQRVWDFAQAAARIVTAEPSLVPTVGGGVAVEWHVRGIELEIELTSTGVLVLLEDETGEVEGPLRDHEARVAAALQRL